MPWNLLILPLLGGFLFLELCHVYRFRFQRLEGYRLLMWSAIWGVTFLSFSRIMTFGAEQFVWGRWIGNTWLTLSPFPFSGTAVGAFVIGFLFAHLSNLRCPEKAAKELVLSESDNDLLKVLYESVKSRKPLLLTLQNRTVYVGYVVNAPNFKQERAAVGLIPLKRGFLRENDLSFIFTTDYLWVYLESTIDRSNFVVVVPLSQITSASWFDPSVEDSGSGTPPG